MALEVACACGATYRLKDEFLGRLLQCNQCGKAFQAVAPPPIARVAQADPVFDRDTFLLRQKAIAIDQKYSVSDEYGQAICYIVRPTFLGRQLLALVGAIGAALVMIAILVGIGAALGEAFLNTSGGFVFLVSGLVLVVVTAVVVGVALAPKRHVLFYRDEARQDKLLDVLQDRKWQIPVATYTCRDAAGNVIANFRKNYLYNLFRKRWDVLTADRSAVICCAREDSILLSLLRRWLGPIFGLLRTNFIITPPDSEEIIGEFNRKMTILDRYVLDLRRDPARQLDRRIALALGVMLDTGERR